MARWDDGVCWHLELVSPPAEEPLTLAFVRDQHLRLVNVTVEDAWITRAITAARLEGERFTRRAWMTQSWRQVLDRFPCGREIALERPPLQSVDRITYVDADGNEQTLDDTHYTVITPRGPWAPRGRVVLAYDEAWPATRSGTPAAVQIDFTCGYVDSGSPPAADVPAELTTGMLLAIGELYKQRSESIVGSGTTVNAAYRTARNYWAGYRVF